MKRTVLIHRYGLLAVLLLLVPLAAAQSQQADTAEALLGRALHLEEVSGDLSGALRLYERIVEEFPESRALAARALLQMGRCYERLGNLQARAAYERILNDYADQGESAALARTRLADLQASEAAKIATAASSSGPVDREIPEIRNTGGGIVVPIEMSPDDRRILVYGVAGGQNVGVYDRASQETTWLTNHQWNTPEVAMPVAATWSADGTRVAYSTIRRPDGPESDVGEIWIAQPGQAGEVVFQLERTTAYVSGWLADGRGLVALLQRPDQSMAIGIVTVDDGGFRQLKTLEWARPIFPAASPDGRFVVFEDGTRDARDLFIAATDGSTIDVLDGHPALDTEPLWSPDGRHIAFRSGRQGIEGIWAVPVRDGRPDGQPLLVTDRAEGMSLLSWTPGGIFYRKAGGVSDIYTVDFDPASGRVTGDPRMLPYPETGSNLQPRWSPDGRYLAFFDAAALFGSSQRSLVVLPAAGGQALRVQPPDEALSTVSNIRWRSDGGEISLNSRDRQDRPILLRLSLPDAAWTVEPLPDDLWYVYFDWDPQWQRFFYYRPIDMAAQAPEWSDDPPGLYEVNRETGERRHLWEPPIQPIRDIVASPDGRYVAFTTQSRLCIFDRTTGEGRQIADIKAVPGLAWSPDSRRVLYIGNDAPGTGGAEGIQVDLRLRTYDLLSGVSSDLELPEMNSGTPASASLYVGVATPVWVPDGRAITFVHRANSMAFRILENPLTGNGAADSRQ